MSTVIDGSASVTINNGAVLGITSGTAVASTSGTSIDFTSIPSWVKRITVMFQGVSTNGTSIPLIQLGTGGVPTTTGYVSTSSEVYTAASTNTSTAGFNIYFDNAGYIFSGSYTFVNVSGNIWVGSSVTSSQAVLAVTTISAGVVTLSGALNMVRLTTAGGTNTFDAGSVNIMYEG
jgi:hypothetical protein